MELNLAVRFAALWKRCTDTDSDRATVWEALYQRYTEDHRCYHTLEHVAHCLLEFDRAAGRIGENDAVELAIWFHDIIYEPDCKDNEAASADFFRTVARPVMDANLVELVCQLILATVHADEPLCGAPAYIVDIDLSSFGLPWDDFLRDSNNLRREGSAIPDAEFYRNKAGFLNALLQRRYIFNTEFFREAHERKARQNIERYLAMIHDWGFDIKSQA